MDHTSSQCWVGWSYGTLASFKVGEGFTLEWSWLWNGWEDNVGLATFIDSFFFAFLLIFDHVSNILLWIKCYKSFTVKIKNK